MDLPDLEAEHTWRETLRQIEREGLMAERLFDLDAECLENYQEWYIKTKMAALDNPSALEVIAGARLIEHTLKLTLVFSVLQNDDGDNYIHKDAFEAAKAVAEYWSSVTVKLFTSLTFDKTSKLEREIIRVIGQNNGSLKRSELRRKLSGRTNTKDLNEALNSLGFSDVIGTEGTHPQTIHLLNDAFCD